MLQYINKRLAVAVAMPRKLAFALAPYHVVDSYGTMIDCWSINTATEWLKFCSPFAVIYNRWTKQVIAQRVQLKGN